MTRVHVLTRQNKAETARRTGLDWRTVRKWLDPVRVARWLAGPEVVQSSAARGVSVERMARGLGGPCLAVTHPCKPVRGTRVGRDASLQAREGTRHDASLQAREGPRHGGEGTVQGL